MSAKPIIIPDPKLDDEPIAHLEHELIVSFLREKGHTLESIKELSELEARSRFVDTLHEAGKSVES
jgi:hypothetical protein